MKGILEMVGGIVLLGILISVGIWMNQHGAVDNVNNIEFIQAHCYNGIVIDLQNEVGVRSVDDVKWYYDEHDTICIEYGKILLKYKISDFVTDKTQKELNSVFVTTEQHPETLEFKLYWQGEEITEYVKR